MTPSWVFRIGHSSHQRTGNGGGRERGGERNEEEGKEYIREEGREKEREVSVDNVDELEGNELHLCIVVICSLKGNNLQVSLLV